jgi:hypothetical protein
MLHRFLGEAASRAAIGVGAIVLALGGMAWQAIEQPTGTVAGSLFEHVSVSNIIAIGAILLQVVWAFRDLQALKARADKVEHFLDVTLPATYMPREVCEERLHHHERHVIGERRTRGRDDT